MQKEQYKARNGNMQWRPVLSERQYLNAEDEYEGFCLACGATRGECELDARNYTCERCEQPKVFGIPELLMMGLAKIK
jgi:hypothetical protein